MSALTVDDKLLTDLKEKLQITWEDAETNRNLSLSIENGKRYFNELCETKFTFEEASTERELLMERCRYDWNNAIDEFETNFKPVLGRLIMDVAIKQYEEAKADEQANT